MPEVNPAQVVIMGLVTVFIALICLIIIIVLLGKIMTAVTGNKASQTTPAQAPAPAPAAPAAVPAPAAQPGNQQLVAAIAAAIAEDMGEDVDHIKILSIRRVSPPTCPLGEPTSLKSFDLNREGINYENLSCQCKRHCL